MRLGRSLALPSDCAEQYFMQFAAEAKGLFEESLEQHAEHEFLEEGRDDGGRDKKDTKEADIRRVFEHFDDGVLALFPEADQQTLKGVDGRGQHDESDETQADIANDVAPGPAEIARRGPRADHYQQDARDS